MMILPHNGMDFDDNFPLFTAIGKGVNGDECLGIIQLLIEYGANINACNPKPIVDGMCKGVVEKCLTYGCMEFLRYFIIDRKIEIPEIAYVRGGINPITQEKYSLTEILNTEDYQFEDYPSARMARNDILDFLKKTNQN